MGVLLITLAPTSAILASGENNGRGSRAIALGNAFVAIADNAWAISYNPAGLAHIRALTGSVFFVPQQFQLDQLKTAALAVAVPLEFAVFGFSAEQFGFELYKETNVTIAAGRSIDWGVTAGIGLNLHRVSIDRYGSAQRLTLDLGLFARPQDDLSFGFALKNIAAATIGQQRERLPQVISLGFRYGPWPDFQLTAEAEKDTRHPLIAKAGIEQRFFEVLALRLGVSSNPDKFCAGIGARYSFVEFGYAGYSHPHLGWTHQVEVSFYLQERD